MKNKGAVHDTWSHHETMITNLRDWVSREIASLHRDVAKEVPHLEDEPHVQKMFSRVEDLSKNLFETVSDLREILEKEAGKAAKKAKADAKAAAAEADPPDDEHSFIDA